MKPFRIKLLSISNFFSFAHGQGEETRKPHNIMKNILTAIIR